MYTVLWMIRPNEGTSQADISQELEGSRSDYSGAKGLAHAAFGISSDRSSVMEVSMWDSQAAAEAFFTREREADLSRRWQAAPMQRTNWDTPAVL